MTNETIRVFDEESGSNPQPTLLTSSEVSFVLDILDAIDDMGNMPSHKEREDFSALLKKRAWPDL